MRLLPKLLSSLLPPPPADLGLPEATSLLFLVFLPDLVFFFLLLGPLFLGCLSDEESELSSSLKLPLLLLLLSPSPFSSSTIVPSSRSMPVIRGAALRECRLMLDWPDGRLPLAWDEGLAGPLP